MVSRPRPSWLAVSDAHDAQVFLLQTAEWAETYGPHLGLTVVPCWPWHPGAVELLSVASLDYRATYRDGSASDVSDLLLERIPAVQQRLARILDGCSQDGHSDGSTRYAADRERLPDLAAWWASGREGVAPGLSALE